MENNQENEYVNFDNKMIELKAMIKEYVTARKRHNGEYILYKKDLLEFMRKIILEG